MTLHIDGFRLKRHKRHLNAVDSISPDEEHTVSSASLLISPQPAERRVAPLCASTPLPCNGVGKLDRNSNCEKSSDILNGNSNGNLVAESTNSIDVLSGGESDAGDTLRSHRHNSSLSLGIGVREGSYERTRRRAPNDLLYSIAKELLMTERTYKRDLELVTVSWSVRVSSLASLGSDIIEALGRPCLALEPIALAQGAFLAKLEKCMANSVTVKSEEEPEYRRISEFLYDYLNGSYDAYVSYAMRAGVLVARLESARRGERGAEGAAAGVGAAAAAAEEAERGAPLSLAALVLRPLHRLLYYRDRVQELSQIEDSAGTRQSWSLLERATEIANEQLVHAENHAMLCQLQREIIGFDKLLVADREFVRMGCIYKHSSKGLQQRMLFLFSDILILSSKSSNGSQFKAHIVWALNRIRLEPSDMPHSFTLTGDESSTTLSAVNEGEFVSWCNAIDSATSCLDHDCTPDTALSPYSEDVGNPGEPTSGGSGGAVCWHRHTSLSRHAVHIAMRSQVSGYLLRKFKKSVGWQKLWVVCCDAALYFYKAPADPRPLVSLPLWGYVVRAATEADGINKELVFRLSFNTHVYYFRADTHYTYRRWVETLQSLQCDD